MTPTHDTKRHVFIRLNLIVVLCVLGPVITDNRSVTGSYTGGYGHRHRNYIVSVGNIAASIRLMKGWCA